MWSLYLKVQGRLKTAVNLVFFLWLIKSLKNFLNHLEKCGRFSISQYSFRPSQSTVELLKSYEGTDRFGGAFNSSDAFWAVVLNIKAFSKI